MSNSISLPKIAAPGEALKQEVHKSHYQCCGTIGDSNSLGCVFFERSGEKLINVGTMLMFRILFISDGVLCFLLFFV